MSTLSLAAITALGPLFVFLFQIVERRVAYAPATMTGLMNYFTGAVLMAMAALDTADKVRSTPADSS